MFLTSDLLDDRQIALLIWGGIILLWLLIKTDFKKQLPRLLNNLLQAFLKRTILVSFILMSLYITGMLYLLQQVNLWNVSRLADTVLWAVGVAFVTFINLGDVPSKDQYFRNVVFDNLKLAVLLEFVVNFYVFDLWVELIFMPILLLTGAIEGVASAREESEEVGSCLKSIMGVVGAGLLAFAAWRTITDVQTFASIATLKEFVLPLILTLAFLPFLYMLALHIMYDWLFKRIEHIVKSPSLIQYAKVKTIFAFHLNLNALRGWLRKIVFLDLDSRVDIDSAIRDVKTSNS